ncbi:MAG TPA: adenylyl-sulfate kinase, partial [Rubricoccaceae bacterium]
GSVPEDQLAAVERASRSRGLGALDLALVTDGLRAEREQGITIDVAYRSFSTPRRQFLVADTPGHVQYTRNMVTGASTAALAVVLVDAVRGLQTQGRRHAFVASLLGIPQLVFAVNKMDLVGFGEAAFEAVRADVLDFTSRLRVSGVTVLPVAALTGDNVAHRGGAMPWYDGPTLLHHLETVSVAGARNLRDLRVPVGLVLRPDAAAGGEGAGRAARWLAATVASGILRPGDEVVVLPEGTPATVATVATFDGPLDEARAGDAVVVTLDRDVDVGRGQMLVRPGNRPATTTALDATLCWMAEAPLVPGRRYRLRHTTREVAATVDTVVYRVDVDTLHREAAPTLGLNDVGRVRLSTAEPVAVDPYEVNRETGAFVLLDADTFDTVAAGMVRGPSRDDEALAAPAPAAVSPGVVWEGPNVALGDREAAQGHPAAVVWLTGRPASGKSTVARAVERRLFAAGVRTALLDGDAVRHGLSGDLAFSPADRTENLRRAAEVAALMADAGLVVLCSFVSPLRADRAAVLARLARDLPPGRVVEVYVDADLDTARARDPKGLYARADRGDLPGLTGVGAPYEPPGAPDLHLDTARLSVAEAVEAVVSHLVRAGLTPSHA